MPYYILFITQGNIKPKEFQHNSCILIPEHEIRIEKIIVLSELNEYRRIVYVSLNIDYI